ncbi:hypothetical protein [Odoribacter lunatus]|uniref:hypothetical protein n=1 Tax=Odoribacter lunatus TaxID=2941335 RepID=UPI00203C8416|nr:hypothetical protein [Odoribacter lunatus]
MAQGDIIETMLGWILQLFGWIFKMLFNLCIWLVGGIFKLLGMGIKALFNKNN